jgi:hypothetical protein
MMKFTALVAAAVLAVLAVAGCGSSGPQHPAGPPKAAALAARLGCHVRWADSSPQWSYDTTQYVDAFGGPCSDGTIEQVYTTIITFPSLAKETDWLHQNGAAENSSLPDGYYDVVAGHLWAVASGGIMGSSSYVVRKLGGKDTTF